MSPDYKKYVIYIKFCMFRNLLARKVAIRHSNCWKTGRWLQQPSFWSTSIMNQIQIYHFPIKIRNILKSIAKTLQVFDEYGYTLSVVALYKNWFGKNIVEPTSRSAMVAIS